MKLAGATYHDILAELARRGDRVVLLKRDQQTITINKTPNMKPGEGNFTVFAYLVAIEPDIGEFVKNVLVPRGREKLASQSATTANLAAFADALDSDEGPDERPSTDRTWPDPLGEG